MVSKKELYLILTASLIMTLSIFSIGIMLNYGLDFLRLEEVLKSVEEHNINVDSYYLQTEFIDSVGGDQCTSIAKKVESLRIEIKKVGKELTDYSAKTLFKKKDFDYLKRKYFLLEIQFYTLLNEYNEECPKKNIPILFFYKIDDRVSERQGYILEDISLSYKEKISVLSFDIEYEDEKTLRILKQKFNVTNAPTIVIGNKVIYPRLVYTGEINSSIDSIYKTVDEYSKNINFSYVLETANTSITEYITWLDNSFNNTNSSYAKGDILLIKGRLLNDKEIICQSIPYYDQALQTTASAEERALLYETIASIGCGRNKQVWTNLAADEWEKANVSWRADIDKKIANNKRIEQKKIKIELSQKTRNPPENFKEVIIGESKFTISNNTKIVSQSDRVTRDFLTAQIKQDLNGTIYLSVFMEKHLVPKEELYPEIGWHEGGRIKQIIGYSEAQNKVIYGTMIHNINGTWYAPNEEGIFMFEVPRDKISYPTTRFLSNDVAIVMDTHGANTIVEQAIREKADVVIACCDHPAKVKAAEYMSKYNITTICFTDKYVPNALLTATKIFGSPPVNQHGKTAVVGDQPIRIKKSEQIIVQNINTSDYGISYYDTPARYFETLNNFLSNKLNLKYVQNTGKDQINQIIKTAKDTNSTVIAVRVYDSYDYQEVSQWLNESKKNRAVLFHSAPYPYGQKIFMEYPKQTSYDDTEPQFE